MPVGVGVIGAGVVGGGVVELLVGNRGVTLSKTGVDVRLMHVADLNTKAIEAFDLTEVAISNDAHTLIADPAVHIVCELIGGIEPAKSFVLEALNAGKHVVTANKKLLAMHGEELCAAAVANGVELRYEASTGGCIPIIKAIRESLAANRISHAYGILNGTCNYILTRMTYEGSDFDSVLADAQANGFAETPPDLDINGDDTAHKCLVLASLAFSSRISLDDIHVEGITKITAQDVAYAREMGYLIKLLAIMRDDGETIEARVHPTLVPEEHLLAAVRYEFNGVFVQSDFADATLHYGRGAGRKPTASAVVADVVDIARRAGAAAEPPFVYDHTRPLRPMGDLTMRYYLRLTTKDKPGVLGKVCTILGAHGVSIASCIQKEKHDGDNAHVILMSWEANESAVQEAVREIDALPFVTEETHLLRVL